MRRFMIILTALLLTCSAAAVPEQAAVPVLMYHAVSDKIWGSRELFVSPEALEEQIVYLLNEGYTPVTFEDIPRLDKIEKPVMLTFDDGYRDNYINVYPLLKKYNVKATFFIITDTLDHKLYMDENMLRELSDSGLVSIQSHTVHHVRLDKLNESQLDEELRDSAYTVAKITGKEPIAVCYPFGAYGEKVKDAAEKYYDWGVCINGRCWNCEGCTMEVTRMQVKRSTTICEFEKLLQRK